MKEAEQKRRNSPRRQSISVAPEGISLGPETKIIESMESCAEKPISFSPPPCEGEEEAFSKSFVHTLAEEENEGSRVKVSVLPFWFSSMGSQISFFFFFLKKILEQIVGERERRIRSLLVFSFVTSIWFENDSNLKQDDRWDESTVAGLVPLIKCACLKWRGHLDRVFMDPKMESLILITCMMHVGQVNLEIIYPPPKHSIFPLYLSPFDYSNLFFLLYVVSSIT